MGIDNTNFTIIRGLGGKQTVIDVHLDLTNNIQIRGCEKIIYLGNGPFKGVFHRNHPQI